MNNKLLALARKKLTQLQKQYRGFTTVILDNWRGYRFIYDTSDIKSCSGNCKKCPLYGLLKDKKETKPFSIALLPASVEDQKIFGPQPFLNCKTLNQYQQCYVNWLVTKTKTKAEIEAELKLIKNCKIIYSKKTSNLDLLESQFKKNIVMSALRQTTGRKKQTIKNQAIKMGIINFPA